MQPLVIRSIRGEEVARPPVWLMRQAGRYMSEYRELKQRHGFLDLCRSPELAFEVSMQPIRAFDMDAAIVFSDILLPVEALGIKVSFNPGPQISNPLKTRSDIEALGAPGDPKVECSAVMEALSALSREFDASSDPGGRKAVIGFAGAPWTLASYLVDRGPLKGFQGALVAAKSDPGAFDILLKKLSDLVSDYLMCQLESGADAVQLFDTWAGNLSADDYRHFALPCISEIIEKLRTKAKPVLLYVNGSSHLLEAMAESGADCLSIDWRTDLSKAYGAAGSRLAIQGNLDPSSLFYPLNGVRSEARRMIGSIPEKTRYVANLGHGVLQETPVESVKAFVDAVKEGW